MKCFHIVNTDVIPGFHISYGGSRPYVLCGSQVYWRDDYGSGPRFSEELGRAIPLSNDLIDELTSIRVRFCDLGSLSDGRMCLVQAPPLKGPEDCQPCLLMVRSY